MGRGIRFGRSLALLLGAAVVTTVVASAAAAGPSATPVLLFVNGSSAARISEPAGKSVTVTAAATLKPGDRLAIFAARSSESKLRLVVVCAKATCGHAWRETTAQSVGFQAAITRTVGGALKVVGKSRIAVITWRAAVPPPPPPAPAPPPPPTVAPGHYQGTDSQNEMFAFDVTADGKSIVNVTTGQVNKSCNPDVGVYLDQGRLNLPGPFPINAGGSFSMKVSPTNVYAYETATIAGQFSGALASGTLVVDDLFSDTTCSSGKQTWNVTKTG